jgi:antitoxin MazE
MDVNFDGRLTDICISQVYLFGEDFMAVIEKTSKVARWGNSLGFRIPQEGVDQLQLKEGQSVNVRVKSDTITIRRAKGRKKWTEKELLKGVTPAMCGPDLIPGRKGKELL